MRYLRVVLLMGLCTLIFQSGVAADEPYRIKAGFDVIQLAGKFRYIQREKPLTVNHIDSALLLPFRPAPSAIPIFPDRTHWYSVCFRLVNESSTPVSACLFIDNPIIDSLQVSFCDKAGCRSFPMESVLDPRRQTLGATLRHQYPVLLLPGRDYTVFVTVANRLSWQRLRLPVQLIETGYYPTFMFWRGLFEKLYVGTLFFVILFTLAALILFGESIYAYYLIYLCGLAFFFVSRENYLLYFSTADQIYTHTWLILGAGYALMALGYFGFAQNFLNAHTFVPRRIRTIVTLFRAGTFVYVGLYFIDLLTGQNMLRFSPATVVIFTLNLLLIWLFVYFAFRYRYKPVYLFCLGFTPVCAYVAIVDNANATGYMGQNLLTVFYSIHIFELFILTIGLLVRFRLIQHEKEALQRRVAQYRQTQLETIIQTQESERQRIAADLHDDLGGTLATIRRRIADIRIQHCDPQTARQLAMIQPLIQKSNADLRRIAHNLMPPEFTRIGLCAALRQLVVSQPSQPTQFSFITAGTEFRLSAASELNLYRIVSELVQNIDKHAQADRAAIQILYYESQLTITVEDNGLGNRSLKSADGHIGIGLKNSSLRAEYIGAKLWREVSESGTLTVLDVPYSTTPDAGYRPYPILLIDDHRLFNDGLKSLLDEQPGLSVCGQVFQAVDALPAIHRSHPQLILLDVNLQGTNGIDLGRKIVADFPPVRVLMLTMYNQPKLLDEARRAGLHGYLLKDATTVELLRGINDVLAGKTHFDTAVTNALQPAEDSFGDDFARRLNLTFREVEIIRLIREGLSNDQIADRIHLSIETVKTHRKNIHFKLGISKVTDLIQFAIRHGL